MDKKKNRAILHQCVRVLGVLLGNFLVFLAIGRNTVLWFWLHIIMKVEILFLANIYAQIGRS